jgi:hypothetical protein
VPRRRCAFSYQQDNNKAQHMLKIFDKKSVIHAHALAEK